METFNENQAGPYLYVTEPITPDNPNPLVYIFDATTLLPGLSSSDTPLENNPIEPPRGRVLQENSTGRISQRYIPDYPESLTTFEDPDPYYAN